MSASRVLVTGGAGFIGSAYVRHVLASDEGAVAGVFDLLTYAGHQESLAGLPEARVPLFVGDVADRDAFGEACRSFEPTAIVHFAAETHVDRSLVDPYVFLRTNVQGAQVAIDVAAELGVRLVLVSTDEVYGDRTGLGAATPDTLLRPGNVYAASKAAGDLLAGVAHREREQDVIITRCTNNYGPRQLPEKLIPLMILRASRGESLPVYGDGLQVREWIHVDDHAAGIHAALERGVAGRTYHFAGGDPRANLSVVEAIAASAGVEGTQVAHVTDRPGHDRLYALDDEATRAELGWAPATAFEDGLAATIAWYQANSAWCAAVAGDELHAFLEANYGGRDAHPGGA